MGVADLGRTRARILVAAEDCFRHRGVNRSTIEEVAAAADVSRKTVYRLFGDRQGLITSLLRKRFHDILDELEQKLRTYGSFAEALVEGPLFAMRRLGDDALYLDLIETERSRGLEFVLILDPVVEAHVQSLWAPIFRRARRDKILLSDLTDERLISGLISIAAMLTLRVDLDVGEKRRFLQDFLAPALLGVIPSPPPAPTGGRRAKRATA